MAFVIADRVQETTTTAGTGTITLAGASTGFQSFAAIGNGNNTYYTIAGRGTSEWEVGIGTYSSSGTTLSRDTVLSSSNSGSLVNFSAGTKDVFVTPPSSRSVLVQSAGSGLFAGTTAFTANGAVYASSTSVLTSGTLPVASGGTGLTSGTSGGIPYYSASATIASSAALAANALVIGGGAGVAPSTTTTGTGVLTALGTAVGSAGAFVVNGGALGTPSSGTVTNLTGTASININGTVGATTPTTGAFTTLSASSTVSGTGFSTYLASPPAIGGTTPSTGNFTSVTSTSEVVTGAAGILTRAAATQDGVELIGRAGGTTSLKVTLTPTTLTASRTLTLPDNSGTVLTSGATVTVAQGGTGQTTYTDGQLLIGNTTGNTLTKATLTAGTGITVTNGSGAITITNAGVTGLTGTANQVTVSASTGSVTLSTPQSIGTASSVQFGSFGVGTAASGTSGEIRATNNVTAYYSDDRLKTRLGTIDKALEKVGKLTGFYYHANETAQALGYKVKREVGVSAQEVQAVLPEIIAPAPVDEQYMTIYYERLVPLLIEAVKELTARVAALEAKGN